MRIYAFYVFFTFLSSVIEDKFANYYRRPKH